MTDTTHGDQGHVEDMQKHVRVYIMVFGALALLTIVTVAVGYLRLPTVPAVALGVLIASVKASLVAAYFMHLISEERVIYWILGFTVVFFLGMIILTTSSVYDQVGGSFVP